MINKRIIKPEQVIFIYSQPPEEALIGYIESVDYPIVTVSVVPRSRVKNKFGKIQKIDISKNISLTIMTVARIKEYMTPKEKKYLKKIKKENKIIDLFAGDH